MVKILGYFSAFQHKMFRGNLNRRIVGVPPWVNCCCCYLSTWKKLPFLQFSDRFPNWPYSSLAMTVTALMIPSAGFIPLLGLVNSLTRSVTSFISLDIRDLPLTSTVISLCRENDAHMVFQHSNLSVFGGTLVNLYSKPWTCTQFQFFPWSSIYW